MAFHTEQASLLTSFVLLRHKLMPLQPKLPITSVAIVLGVGGVILETVSHAPVLGLFLPRVLQARARTSALPVCGVHCMASVLLMLRVLLHSRLPGTCGFWSVGSLLFINKIESFIACFPRSSRKQERLRHVRFVFPEI